MNNVPYASLTAVMTSDPDERTSISSYRQIAANFAGFIVASLAIPMVRFFGHGDDALGYQLTMGLLSVLSVVFFVIAFLTTKERIQPNPQQKTSLSQDLSDLFKNRPWIVLFLATLFYFAAHRSARQRDAALLPICCRERGPLRLVQWIRARLTAPRRCLLHCSLRSRGQAAALRGEHDSVGRSSAWRCLCIPPSGTVAIIGTEVLRQFSFGLSGPILWAMMGDVADYGEWKTGRRASGTVTAAVVFALWAGLALGGAIAGWLFSLYGFVSEAALQTAHAQSGILLTASVYAGLAFLATAVVPVLLSHYPRSQPEDRRRTHRTAQGVYSAGNQITTVVRK